MLLLFSSQADPQWVLFPAELKIYLSCYDSVKGKDTIYIIFKNKWCKVQQEVAGPCE